MVKSSFVTVLTLAALMSGAAHAQASDDDARLAEQVRVRLQEQPSLKALNITVRSAHHAIYLEGLVDTRVDLATAEQVARSVPGVDRVYDGLAMTGN